MTHYLHELATFSPVSHRISPICIAHAPNLCELHSIPQNCVSLLMNSSETAESHSNPARCKRLHGVLCRISAIFGASHSFSRLLTQIRQIALDRALCSRPRHVAAIAILLYSARMGFEDHQARLKRRLQDAPKRERPPRVAPLLRAMRDEIARVAEEKNLSYKDIQEMLAADGLAVSVSTLSRHLGSKRKGREDRKPAPNAANATAKFSPREADRLSTPPQIALTNAEKRAAGGEGRPIPPMPSPFPSANGATKPKEPPDAAVPRASSFPIRRDRERI
jgi:hypothetical protein